MIHNPFFSGINPKTRSFQYYSTKDVLQVLGDEPDSVGEVDWKLDSGKGSLLKSNVGEKHSESGTDTANIQWSTRFWDLLLPLKTKDEYSADITYHEMAELIKNFSKIAGKYSLFGLRE